MCRFACKFQKFPRGIAPDPYTGEGDPHQTALHPFIVHPQKYNLD